MVEGGAGNASDSQPSQEDSPSHFSEHLVQRWTKMKEIHIRYRYKGCYYGDSVAWTVAWMICDIMLSA